jgi:plasmid stabilization system protein ParE
VRLRFTRRSLRDLDHVRWYVSEADQAAANRVIVRIRGAIESLKLYPHLGRAGRLAGTRELVVSRTPYVALTGWPAMSSRSWPSCTEPALGGAPNSDGTSPVNAPFTLAASSVGLGGPSPRRRPWRAP